MATISIPQLKDRVISIAFVRLECPDPLDSVDLNFGAGPLGTNGVSIAINTSFVERLDVAFGSVASANFAVAVTATVELVKGSETAKRWLQRALENPLLNGNVIIYDDANTKWELFIPSVNLTSLTANGKEPCYTFEIAGNLLASEKLLATLGIPPITVF